GGCHSRCAIAPFSMAEVHRSTSENDERNQPRRRQGAGWLPLASVLESGAIDNCPGEQHDVPRLRDIVERTCAHLACLIASEGTLESGVRVTLSRFCQPATRNFGLL